MLGSNCKGSELGNCQVIVDRFSNIENDYELLKRVQEEKDIIFPSKVKDIRRKNGFWLSEDFDD